MKNDMQIKQDVTTELDGLAGSVGVEVHHGVVKLAGRVNDPAMKKDAELAARRVDDVTNVVMDIDVAGQGQGSAAIG